MSRLALFIFIVMALTLPVAAQSQSESYTVQYGDVLDVLAAHFDASVACIAQASGLDNPNKMRPGQVLRISPSCPPYDGAIPIVHENTSDQGGGAANAGGYTVVRGDVLDSIAQRFDVSLSCLIDDNNLTQPSHIFIGDVLTIDANCPPYDDRTTLFTDQDSQDQGGGSASTYTVRRGDVLDLIAARFNVQEDCLAAANNLANKNRIFPGDQLSIDASCPAYDGEALNT